MRRARHRRSVRRYGLSGSGSHRLCARRDRLRRLTSRLSVRHGTRRHRRDPLATRHPLRHHRRLRNLRRLLDRRSHRGRLRRDLLLGGAARLLVLVRAGRRQREHRARRSL
ncbi:hypothetical protein, partial [Streptomyces pseudogriseolus]|uniref:hypothetical protein n=1 Tax=Streptomyces pseudogriseolus TaxID=36817 RepID=UPI001CE33B43